MDEKNRKNFIETLKNEYPFIEHKVLSKSVLKKDIDYIKIGKTKNSVLFVGATHGSEWITTSLLLHFLEEICQIIVKNKKIIGIDLKIFFENSSIIILPCLNPDGVEIQINGSKSAKKYKKLVCKHMYNKSSIWQANARGVDLNHNFDAGWQIVHKLEEESGIFGPTSTRYGGKAPFTEPETIAIKKLCEEFDFRHVISFHSQGKEIFWKYGDSTPASSKIMAKLFAILSSYKISEPEGMAVGGGLKDWYIEKYKKPGFTIEVGLGENPLLIFQLPEIYKDLFKSLVLAIVL
jgi:g-D-glutamyl-meso-diaminopimelate peptidase